MLLTIVVTFLAYRMVRPMNIFVVDEAFAHPIPVTTPPAGLQLLSADASGQCHSGIYDEWSGSTHAQAWTDPY